VKRNRFCAEEENPHSWATLFGDFGQLIEGLEKILGDF